MLNQSLVVVTGGGRGLGRVFARRLAQSGARVVITGRDPETLSRSAAEIGHGTESIAFDVTDAGQVRDAFAEIERRFGPVEALVNNAGVLGPVDYFWRSTPLEWYEALDINLKGTVLCSHAVLDYMIARERGTIINIASNAGVFRWPTSSSYSVSKAAIIKLTENLAVEVRGHHVSLFAYHPGLIHSVGMSMDLQQSDVPGESMKAKLLEWCREEHLAGRTVEPEKGAEHVAQLCGGGYSALSGRYLTVYDDLDVLLNAQKEVKRQDFLTLRVREFSPALSAGSGVPD